MTKCCYISGPMSGWPDHNIPAFAAAADRLRAKGYVVRNPADTTDLESKLTRADYMRLDIHAIIGCPSCKDPVDFIAVLPYWHTSRGARLEVEVGLEIGAEIRWADTLKLLTRFDFEVAREYEHRDYLTPHGGFPVRSGVSV